MRDCGNLDAAKGSLTFVSRRHPPPNSLLTAMRKASICLLLASITACASNQQVSGSESQAVRVTAPGGGELRLRANDQVNLVIVSDTLTRVWSVLPAAYDSLGLTPDPTLLDPKLRVIGTGSVKLRRKLGDAPLSRYIDCGNSTQIGPSADSYDIMLTVKTQLLPQPGGATGVSTIVEAAGKPMNFAQGYSSCGTTGKLEKAIGDVVRAKLR